MTDTRAWFAGVPIEPDVLTLMDSLSVKITPGATISHEDMERILHTDRKRSRYRSVVAVFRRRVFEEKGLVLDGRIARGEGLKVLIPSETVTVGIRRLRSHVGGIRRTGRHVSSAPEGQLTHAERTRRDHVIFCCAKVSETFEETRKRLIETTKGPHRSLPAVNPTT